MEWRFFIVNKVFYWSVLDCDIFKKPVIIRGDKNIGTVAL